jgi:hypothetical protein
LEKVKGERSSKIVGHTHKHTCKIAGMEGNTCTLRGTQRDHCFVVHMSTNINQNTKKHLEEAKENLEI